MTRHLRSGAFALVLVALVAGGCATTDLSSDNGPPRYEDGGAMGEAGYFHDALSPYGRWIELDPYGLCWIPDGLGPGWSPYSQGYWAYSDCGWTWVDSEAWGWAPFHYGRWWLDPQYGWVWLPGTEWAPAWVAWREGDAYVAWAPLPPTIHWSSDVPLYSGGPNVAALPDTWWNVARPTDLTDERLTNRLVPTSDKGTALAFTKDRTRITVQDGKPFNAGVSVDRIETLLGRSVPRLAVVDAPSAGASRGGAVSGSSIALFRPALAIERASGGVSRPPARERPPEAGIVPALTARPGNAVPARGGADGLRLEKFLAGERKRLADAQAHEQKGAKNDAAAGQLARRHALELGAFESWVKGRREAARTGELTKLVGFDRKAAVPAAAKAPAKEPGKEPLRDPLRPARAADRDTTGGGR